MPVRLKVKVRVEGQEISVASRNLSLKGLACLPHPLLKQYACCQLIISLSADIQVSIKGRVVRIDESEVGIDFLNMDPESFVHLKKWYQVFPLTAVGADSTALVLPRSE